MMQMISLSRHKLCQILFAITACIVVLATLDCLYLLEDMKMEVELQQKFISRFPYIESNYKKNRGHKNELDLGKIFSKQCKRPKLNLNHDANKDAYYSMPPLVCNGKSLFYILSGTLHVNRSILGDGKLRSCEFRGIERFSDDVYTNTEAVVLTEEPFMLTVFHDFIHIRCFLEKQTSTENQTQFKTLSQQTLLSVTNPKYSPSSKFNDEHLYDTDKMKLKANNFTSISNFSEPSNKFLYSSSNKTMKLDKNVQKNATINHVNATLDKEMPKQMSPSIGIGVTDDYTMRDYNNYFDVSFQDTIPDFEQFVVQVIPKKHVFKRIHKIQRDRRSLNVVLLILDSMSHLSYQRKLPNTYHYLKDVLGATTMNGYNIVGDATIAAMLPILTGKTLFELPEARKGDNYPYSTFVDSFPIIWSEFKKQGYATLFAEDEPSLGMFNLRLNGFNHVPTDHYMRTFWQAIWGSDLRDQSDRFCTGDVPHHKYLLDYLQKFFIEYRNVSKFALAFSTELTHGNNNPAEYIDNDIVNFFQFLEDGGFIDNTVIITMSDHGARYSKVRKTVQGKLEERLPFMSFVFPKWFRQKYPHLMKNLYGNLDKITTPFDIHETMLDILNISRTNGHLDLEARGMSLLRDIPTTRTCESAHIDIHWCACLQQKDINVDSNHSRLAAAHAVQYINNITLALRKYCARLRLKKILTASLVIPNDRVLKFKTTVEDVPKFYNVSVIDVSIILVVFETTPNDAMFEATVQVHNENRTCAIAEVSRINRYGNQPKCIQEKYPEMLQYCYCKNYTLHTV